MADIGTRLRIKYGLENNPTAAQQARWAEVTRSLIRQGYTANQAGTAAAKTLFADFERMIYASEADTIEMLLRKADE